MSSTGALVIRVGDRYFCSLKRRRLSSAWCLAGATLLTEYDRLDGTIQKYVDTLRSKGYKAEVFKVIIGEEVAPF